MNILLKARCPLLLTQISHNFATKNLKIIKNRMRAVNSIKKITKAMKMVAASKMKQDVNRLQRSKNFGVHIFNKIIDNQPYLQRKRTNVNIKKTLLVPITTDKGLCGGINSSIVRQIKAMVKQDRNGYKLLIIGDKGGAALLRPFPQLVDSSITNLLLPLNFITASSIAHNLIKRQQATQCQRILLLYNKFKNVISQVQIKTQIMSRKTFKSYFKYFIKHQPTQPDNDFALPIFYDFYVSTIIYNALLNNMASQTSARMNAMENASKNAGQIVDKLNLQYNKARQAKITMELCQIISGASAV